MKTIALTVIVAWASQYSPGVMETVIANRQAPDFAWTSLPLELPTVDGHVAVESCGRIGEVIWLMPIGADALESFLIVDCAVPDDSDGARTWMQQRNISCEVDNPTAVRWDTVGSLIRIVDMSSPRLEK